MILEFIYISRDFENINGTRCSISLVCFLCIRTQLFLLCFLYKTKLPINIIWNFIKRSTSAAIKRIMHSWFQWMNGLSREHYEPNSKLNSEQWRLNYLFLHVNSFNNTWEHKSPLKLFPKQLMANVSY